MKALLLSLFRKEELPLLIALGLPLIATLAFMLGGPKETASLELPEKDVLWIRAYLTNLQSGGINQMSVDSVRLARESVIPVLVSEMNVRPPTVAKKLDDKIQKILTRFPIVATTPRVPDGHRAAAANALMMIFRSSDELLFHPATKEESAVLLPVLGNALFDHSPMVRFHAAGCLGAFGVEADDALELCELALADTHWGVRMSAVDSAAALAMANPAAYGLLNGALADAHPEVKNRARSHLRKAGFPVPEDPTAKILASGPYDFE